LLFARHKTDLIAKHVPLRLKKHLSMKVIITMQTQKFWCCFLYS